MIQLVKQREGVVPVARQLQREHIARDEIGCRHTIGIDAAFPHLDPDRGRRQRVAIHAVANRVGLRGEIDRQTTRVRRKAEAFEAVRADAHEVR